MESQLKPKAHLNNQLILKNAVSNYSMAQDVLLQKQ